VYSELNPSDRIRVDSGLSILPKGQKGTIVDNVKGKDTDTGYISVTETKQYSSNNGLAKIDVTKATQNIYLIKMFNKL